MELLSLLMAGVFILVIVIVFTRGVFSRDLTSALKRVEQQEQELQGKADILEQRIRQMEQDYHAKVKRAEIEAERLLEEAKRHSMNIQATAIDEAKHRARQLFLEVEQGRAQLKAEVARELNGKAIQHACDALQRLLPQPLLHGLHDSLIRELLEAVTRVEVTPVLGASIRVEVVSAQPLAAAQWQQLTQWAAAALGANAQVERSLDPALVAGGVVRVGSTVVDNSLRRRLGQS